MVADTTFLQADLGERARTDVHISPLLLLLIAALWMLSIVPVLFTGLLAENMGEVGTIPALLALAFSLLLGLGSWAVSIYITYQLVSRRDKHFRRLARLAEDAAVYLRARSEETGAELGDPQARLAEVERAMRTQAAERGAVIWTILCALAGIVYPVLWYVLMDDYARHETNEVALTAVLNHSFALLGTEAGIAFQQQIPARRFWLYLLGTLITFGVFGIYWLYVMIADPNQHFQAHADWESRLARAAQ